MTFLKKLFGEKIKNENRSKPFHENKNSQEMLDWFARTRPWDKVSPELLATIIKKFNGSPMLELFVIYCMENKLVNKYAQLNDSDFKDDVLCSKIAMDIYFLGSGSFKKFISLVDNLAQNEKSATRYYRHLMDSFELTVILDENQASAYMNLAMVKGMLGKYADGLKYAKQGYEVIDDLLKSEPPFNQSSIPEIRSGSEDLKLVRNKLLDMVDEYSKKVS